MSNDKLTLKKSQGNVTLVPDNHATEPSSRRAGFFSRRRQLIAAFILFNVVAWTLIVAFTFR